MRFVVFGAGAIGGAVGALLDESGHEVVLVARGAHADAIERRGLIFETPTRSRTARLPVVRNAAEIEFTGREVVLLAVKSQHTASAIDALRLAAPDTTPVACLQNGVANERAALRVFAHVYGVCVMSPTAHLEPGVVQAFSDPVAGILDVGRYPEGSDEVAHRLAEAFRRSCFSAEVRDDIMRWKYAKLLGNLGNAVEAVCGPSARNGPIIAMLRAEGAACLGAAGIEFASEAEDAERRGDLLVPGVIGVRPRGGGSTWQSVERGAGSVETDHLNGEIALLGRLHGVPTPANALLQRLAHDVLRQGAPGSVPPEELLASLGVREGDRFRSSARSTS